MTHPNTPQVSIVLPAYNRASSIVGAIESVLRQTFEDYELIVVDDGSTDGTPEAIETLTDPRIRLIRAPKNIGVSAARNLGIAQARAEWVAFQDSDDEWLPEKLALQMARLQEEGNNWIGAYCGMIIVWDDQSQSAQKKRTRVIYHPRSRLDRVEGDISKSLLETSLISTQMLIVKSEHLRSVQGFDESLSALVDWDLVLRLSDYGPFAFVDEPLVMQRFSDNSITRDLQRRTVAREQLLSKHHDRLSKHPQIYAQQLRVLAGEQRQVGKLHDAAKTMGRAVKLQPLRPDLLIRLFYLRIVSLLGRTR